MQTNRNNRARPAQAPKVAAGRSRYAPEVNDRQSVLLLTALCVLLPPVGVALLWHAKKITLPIRAGLSGAGFLSMLLIFFLIMRPGSQTQEILPSASIPQYVGYGQVAAVQEPVAPVQPVQPIQSEVPAMPDAAPAIPQETAPAATGTPGGLTENTVVFAVTNNASNYHLNQICDTQTNNRALTVSEALNEGLTPCEKCIPATE